MLGLGWTFVNPIVLMGVYTLIFSVLWKTTTIQHYALFVISGLAIWTFFSGAISMSSSSLLGHANLLKQVKFPRQLLPLAVVGANFVTYAVNRIAGRRVLGTAPPVRGTPSLRSLRWMWSAGCNCWVR